MSEHTTPTSPPPGQPPATLHLNFPPQTPAAAPRGTPPLSHQTCSPAFPAALNAIAPAPSPHTALSPAPMCRTAAICSPPAAACPHPLLGNRTPQLCAALPPPLLPVFLPFFVIDLCVSNPSKSILSQPVPHPLQSLTKVTGCFVCVGCFGRFGCFGCAQLWAPKRCNL